MLGLVMTKDKNKSVLTIEDRAMLARLVVAVENLNKNLEARPYQPSTGTMIFGSELRCDDEVRERIKGFARQT